MKLGLKELIGYSGILTFSIIFIVNGVKGIVKREILLTVRGYREEHTGRSALIWGIIFLLLGIFLIGFSVWYFIRYDYIFLKTYGVSTTL